MDQRGGADAAAVQAGEDDLLLSFFGRRLHSGEVTVGRAPWKDSRATLDPGGNGTRSRAMELDFPWELIWVSSGFGLLRMVRKVATYSVVSL